MKIAKMIEFPSGHWIDAMSIAAISPADVGERNPLMGTVFAKPPEPRVIVDYVIKGHSSYVIVYFDSADEAKAFASDLGRQVNDARVAAREDE